MTIAPEKKNSPRGARVGHFSIRDFVQNPHEHLRRFILQDRSEARGSRFGPGRASPEIPIATDRNQRQLFQRAKLLQLLASRFVSIATVAVAEVRKKAAERDTSGIRTLRLRYPAYLAFKLLRISFAERDGFFIRLGQVVQAHGASGLARFEKPQEQA